MFSVSINFLFISIQNELQMVPLSTKSLKTSLMQANILKFCLRQFVTFVELRGGALRCFGELGEA